MSSQVYMSMYNQAVAATARPIQCPLAHQSLTGLEKQSLNTHQGLDPQLQRQEHQSSPCNWPGGHSHHSAWSSAAGDEYRDQVTSTEKSLPMPHLPELPKAVSLQALGHSRGQPH